ncbi:MAG: hypothetical protein H7338_24515 [Candidatus Sericytochromatia bacterium]|nr:hypothetical protein [Candidatus Sericytochromatia bacterium]
MRHRRPPMGSTEMVPIDDTPIPGGDKDQPDREIRIPLGNLCRKALAEEPDAPLECLRQLFDQRYGDDSQAFLDLCVTQYELSGDPTAWHRITEGRVVAVVHIHEGALPQAAGTAQTFVVEDDDLSRLPPEVMPLVQSQINRRVTGALRLEGLRTTGELRAAPYVPLFEGRERRQAMQAGTLALLLVLAALVWFVGALVGLWPFPFLAVSSGTPTSPRP